jgi:hypothetical protein
VVLLASIGIVVWSQRDALGNPETSKEEEPAGEGRGVSQILSQVTHTAPSPTATLSV